MVMVHRYSSRVCIYLKLVDNQEESSGVVVWVIVVMMMTMGRDLSFTGCYDIVYVSFVRAYCFMVGSSTCNCGPRRN